MSPSPDPTGVPAPARASATPSSHAAARRALNDTIRSLYEDTLVPVREIARLAGVTERNIYALVRRLGCRPRLRLASGGGRQIVPLGPDEGASPDQVLDAESAQRALVACREAIERVSEATAAARTAKAREVARLQVSRVAEIEARGLFPLAQALRALAEAGSGQE